MTSKASRAVSLERYTFTRAPQPPDKRTPRLRTTHTPTHVHTHKHSHTRAIHHRTRQLPQPRRLRVEHAARVAQRPVNRRDAKHVQQAELAAIRVLQRRAVVSPALARPTRQHHGHWAAASGERVGEEHAREAAVAVAEGMKREQRVQQLGCDLHRVARRIRNVALGLAAELIETRQHIIARANGKRRRAGGVGGGICAYHTSNAVGIAGAVSRSVHQRRVHGNEGFRTQFLDSTQLRGGCNVLSNLAEQGSRRT
mmetsp:Transcript_14673/g.51086  ORF Transcript_14673/g.51086 Transcript_14673/m.51086 type:complete len:255 (-) Transcript_14673:759-1523(-)